MGDSGRRRELKAFLKAVEDRLSWKFNLSDFDDRVRLQKYVFLAEAFGYDHEYIYNIYHYGPYSPNLARDYYHDDFSSLSPTAGVDDLDVDAFSAFTSDRSREWLEVAATLKSIYNRYKHLDPPDEARKWAIERAADIKEITESEARGIFEELVDAGVVDY